MNRILIAEASTATNALMAGTVTYPRTVHRAIAIYVTAPVVPRSATVGNKTTTRLIWIVAVSFAVHVTLERYVRRTLIV
jgi:hypothetical protein